MRETEFQYRMGEVSGFVVVWDKTGKIFSVYHDTDEATVKFARASADALDGGFSVFKPSIVNTVTWDVDLFNRLKDCKDAREGAHILEEYSDNLAWNIYRKMVKQQSIWEEPTRDGFDRFMQGIKKNED